MHFPGPLPSPSVTTAGVATAPPGWVLDTHVVLDWLAFGDPRTRFIEPALAAGQARWLATQAMQGEFERVLARSKFTHLQGNLPDPGAPWGRWATRRPAPPPAPWRCSDPDDQVFIDLAVAERATALFTRDKALRRMAARARSLGLWIGPPELWPGRPADPGLAVPPRGAEPARNPG